MALPAREFYVHLPYNVKKDGLERKLNSFITYLDPAIDFGECPYEVVLAQLQDETSIDNIGTGAKIEFILRPFQYIGKDPALARAPPDTFKYTVEIEQGRYTSSLQVLNKINLNLKNQGVDAKFKVFDSENEKEGINKKLRRRGLSHCALLLELTSIYIKTNDYECLLDSIVLYGSLRQIFDIDVRRKIRKNVLEDRTIIYIKSKDDLLCLREYLNTSLGSLFVYTNIFSHQYVGEQQARLLRTVVLPRANKKFDIEFNKCHYFLVHGTYHRFIEIDIRDFDGNLANLTPGEIVLILHFRPVNK